MNIEGNSTHGVVRCRRFGGDEVGCGLGAFVVAMTVTGECFVGEARCLPGLRIGKPRALAVENEFAVIDELHAVGHGESFSTRADKVDMGALL